MREMKIQGLQTLTLLDYPDKTACTVFTPGCNFRCPFCHNAGIVNPEEDPVMTEGEFFDFLAGRKGRLDGVCITGGEPLLQKDIFEFISEIKKRGFLVKLDTNGSFPDILKKAVDERWVDYVAMDIKSSKDHYALTAGVEKLDVSPVEKSVAILKENRVPYEFRTTVIKEYHTLDDIEKIGKWILGAKRYYLQKYVDSGNILKTDGELHAHSLEVMKNMQEIAAKYVETAEIRGM